MGVAVFTRSLHTFQLQTSSVSIFPSICRLIVYVLVKEFLVSFSFISTQAWFLSAAAATRCTRGEPSSSVPSPVPSWCSALGRWTSWRSTTHWTPSPSMEAAASPDSSWRPSSGRKRVCSGAILVEKPESCWVSHSLQSFVTELITLRARGAITADFPPTHSIDFLTRTILSRAAGKIYWSWSQLLVKVFLNSSFVLLCLVLQFCKWNSRRLFIFHKGAWHERLPISQHDAERFTDQ